jgi:hypothetical protein
MDKKSSSNIRNKKDQEDNIPHNIEEEETDQEIQKEEVITKEVVTKEEMIDKMTGIMTEEKTEDNKDQDKKDKKDNKMDQLPFMLEIYLLIPPKSH